MSETKHTPGEWVANRGDHAHITNVLYYGLVAHLGDMEDGSGPLFVCVDDGTVVGEGGDVEMLANARLIAAAPDYAVAVDSLCEALQRAIGNLTLAVHGRPVRDMAETVAEASAAVTLANVARMKAEGSR